VFIFARRFSAGTPRWVLCEARETGPRPRAPESRGKEAGRQGGRSRERSKRSRRRRSRTPRCSAGSASGSSTSSTEAPKSAPDARVMAAAAVREKPRANDPRAVVFVAQITNGRGTVTKVELGAASGRPEIAPSVDVPAAAGCL